MNRPNSLRDMILEARDFQLDYTIDQIESYFENEKYTDKEIREAIYQLKKLANNLEKKISNTRRR